MHHRWTRTTPTLQCMLILLQYHQWMWSNHSLWPHEHKKQGNKLTSLSVMHQYMQQYIIQGKEYGATFEHIQEITIHEQTVSRVPGNFAYHYHNADSCMWIRWSDWNNRKCLQQKSMHFDALCKEKIIEHAFIVVTYLINFALIFPPPWQCPIRGLMSSVQMG